MTVIKVFPNIGDPYNLVVPHDMDENQIQSFMDLHSKNVSHYEASIQGKLIYTDNLGG